MLQAAWRRDSARLADLRPFAEDAGFRDAVRGAKSAAKRRLAEHIRREIGIAVDPASMFDVQAKRIHEYKRQLLNILQVVARFQALRSNSAPDFAPRTVIFAGKAASSYTMAKLIIKLVHDVAKHVNADPRISSNLKVIFLPNYGVSAAELLLPAADLSEQISTAGLEASGTGNMKLALNGALTIGTHDGANLEIRDAIGEDNIFMFGRDAAELERLRAEGYYPLEVCGRDERLRGAVDAVARGAFSGGDRHRFRPIVGSLLHRDPYFVLADFADYVETQARADAMWRDHDAWVRRAVVNVAGMSGFSSDRAVRDYATRIWRIDPTQPASRR
jgi:glycogen phosphorylase